MQKFFFLGRNVLLIAIVLFSGSALNADSIQNIGENFSQNYRNIRGTPPSGPLTISAEDQSSVYTAAPQQGIYSAKIGNVTVPTVATYTDINHNTLNGLPINAGIYTMTVIADGGDQYYGTKKATFEIRPFEIKPEKLIIEKTLFTYNGEQPELNVSVDTSFLPGNIPLTSRDLKIVFNPNNPVNAGTYGVTITPIGNFTGSPFETEITILPIECSILIGNTAQTFNGYAKSVSVTFEGVTPSKSNYTVTYNGRESLPIEAGNYTVKVTCKGNYKGSAMDVLEIAPIKVESATIEIGDLLQKANETHPVSVKITGITPPPTPADYTVTYNGSPTVPIKAGKYTVIVSFIENYSGSASAELQVVSTPIPPIPTYHRLASPGIPITVFPSHFGLPLTQKAPKADALYHKPFARPGASRDRLHVSVKEFDPSSNVMDILVKTMVTLHDKQRYKFEKKSRFTADILADTARTIQVDSIVIPVSFRTKTGIADSTISLMMRPPVIDSFMILIDPVTGTTYYTVFGENFGTKAKMWFEFDNGKKIVRKNFRVVRKNLILRDSRGNLYSFGKNIINSTRVMKMNRFHSDSYIKRLDFVMDNRNGIAAITVR